MLDLYELQQLVAFADHHTLAKVAELFHIATPSVTRSMQHIEDTFGVPLFSRTKNRIELNETGLLAVDYARKLLQDADTALAQVQDFDRKQHTIMVCSCAPAPLWRLLPQISAACPQMTISTRICQNEDVLAAWQSGDCDVAILPFLYEDSLHSTVKKFMQENLYVCVPPEHELAHHETLTFSQINGFNFLLRTELGFWDTLCREKMPSSRFLIQSDEFAFNELIQSSSLPCFTTDYICSPPKGYFGRVNIPLTDAEAQVTFYILMKNSLHLSLIE